MVHTDSRIVNSAKDILMASKAYQTRNKTGGIPHKADSKYAKLVQYYMDVLEYCYPRYKSTLDRMIALENAYNNVIDQSLFPTWAKLATPIHFSMVQEAIPDALDRVWNDHLRTYTLLPKDVDVDMEKLDDIEYGLNYYVRQIMDAKHATLPSIQNAFKAGLGYSAIVPVITSPHATLNTAWIQGGKAIANQRGVGIGSPVKTLMLKNVGLGQIIPSDDGSDFNGHNCVSHAFWIDVYSEGAFRRMFKNLVVDAEDAEVFGDVEFIIKQAGEMGYYTKIPINQIIADLGGIELNNQSGNPTEHRYVNIPVIKCYGDQEIVWIANGTTVIHHEKDPLQILNRNLVKWSVTVDNDKWHPMNPAEAGQTIATGQNLLYNMIIEMVWKSTKPFMLYDKGRFGNKAPVVGANGDVGVDGNVNEAVTFPQHPRIDQGHLSVVSQLDKLYASATGKSNNMSDPSPGMVRGGLHAFEQLLNSSSGRNRLGAMIMEMGAVKPIGHLTMINMQQLLSGSGLQIQERVLDVDDGQERIKRVTLTPEDLQSAYDVSVDTRGKARTITDFNERLGMFQATANDPYVDQYWRHEMLIADYGQTKRAMPSRKKIREIQEQERQAQQQAQQQSAGQSTNNAPGGTAQSIMAGALSNQ